MPGHKDRSFNIMLVLIIEFLISFNYFTSNKIRVSPYLFFMEVFSSNNGKMGYSQ